VKQNPLHFSIPLLAPGPTYRSSHLS
jgi:hypothetical protein